MPATERPTIWSMVAASHTIHAAGETADAALARGMGLLREHLGAEKYARWEAAGGGTVQVACLRRLRHPAASERILHKGDLR